MPQLHLQIDEDHDAAIRRIAAEHRTSRSAVVKTILAKSLDPVAEEIAKEARSGVRDAIKATALAGRVTVR